MAADANEGCDGFSAVGLGANHNMNAGVNADRLR
jgi:hypothetical protein